MRSRELAFTAPEMQRFAAGSGDWSPLHTDEAYARRTSYGACIVYGGLLTIGLVGALPGSAVAALRSLRSSFPRPVYPGERLAVRIVPHPSRGGAWELRAERGDGLAARVVAESQPAEGQATTVLEQASGPAAAAGFEPREGLDALAARLGAAELHPALLDGIGWASYLVGTGAAGMQGLCAAVELTTPFADVPRAGEPARAWCTLADRDPRTGRHLLTGVLYDGKGEARTVARVECFPIPDAEAQAQ